MADTDPIPALIADLRRWSAELATYQDTYGREHALIESAADALAALSAQLHEKGWTCFHCGETFTTPGGARDHFGAVEGSQPGCLVDRVSLEEGGKPERGRGLLMALRKSEEQRAALTEQVERLQVLNDQVAAMGVTDCERADVAEADIVTLTAQLHENPPHRSASDLRLTYETLRAQLHEVTARAEKAEAQLTRERDYMLTEQE